MNNPFAPPAANPIDDLRFDRATYAAANAPAANVAPCGNCGRPLGDPYWKLGEHLVCAYCHERLEATLERSKSAASFGKALFQGGAVALGCGIAYAIFAGVSHMQLAILTIGMAYLIAKVVRKASGGFSGRRFQVLAVVLTYCASSCGYAPEVFQSLTSDDSSESASDAKDGAKETADSPKATGGVEATDSKTPGESAIHAAAKPTSPLWLLFGAAVMGGFILAAPFLAITEAPIGFLIIVFGLWEAWKRSRAFPIVMHGPYRAGAPVMGGPPVG